MAHELYIDEATQQASMAYVGAAPWHGLGQQLTEDADIDTWRVQAGMNFSINSSEAKFKPIDAKAKAPHLIIPRQRVLYRSDTDAPLAIVSDKYQVVQPEEILTFFKDLADVHGFKLETAGVLFNGQKYWALAKTPYETKLGKDDIIKAHLLLATACDGTMSTIARYVNVRTVCNNTLELGLAESGGSVRVNHRTKFNEIKVKQELGLLEAAWEDQVGKLEKLSKRTVTSQEAVDYLIRILGNPDKDVEHQRNAALLAKVHALFDGGGLGATMESSKDTAWGLLNSVTEYVDHYRGVKVDDLSKDRRIESAFFYEGKALKQKALDTALELFI
jgi:phage/plasmid-like protein (TIGR03299 family)